MTLLALAAAYVLGSIPTGLWLGRTFRGIDIREHGSRNIGATNTLRVLGKTLGVFALAGDMGKGLVAVLLVARVSGWPYAPLACGLAAITGHTASLFLRFRGGKAVAVSAGVFLALCPVLMGIGLGVFLAVFLGTRMVSAGSISAALTMMIGVYFLPPDLATYPTHLIPPGCILRLVITLVGLLLIYKHRTNIRRILQGQENRI
jgi:glycerol-3-phosphate acyltransferase PlsY